MMEGEGRGGIGEREVGGGGGPTTLEQGQGSNDRNMTRHKIQCV